MIYGDKEIQKGYIFMPSINKDERIIIEDLYCEKKTVLSKIPFEQLFQLFGNHSFEDLFNKNNDFREHQENQKRMSFRKNIEELKLNHLIYLKELGFGQFGDVYLVVDKNDTEKQYAIKCITR